nr:PREDICTED: TBC1 domain family member 5-like [Balearica regulorum gibbericeps]
MALRVSLTPAQVFCGKKTAKLGSVERPFLIHNIPTWGNTLFTFLLQTASIISTASRGSAEVFQSSRAIRQRALLSLLIHGIVDERCSRSSSPLQKNIQGDRHTAAFNCSPPSVPRLETQTSEIIAQASGRSRTPASESRKHWKLDEQRPPPSHPRSGTSHCRWMIRTLAVSRAGRRVQLGRWVRLLFGREFPLQDLLVVWDALFADSITLNLVDYIFVAMLLYIRDALISSNYQTCLGLLMHYPPIGDVHSLILRALFLRDPKRNPRPVTHQFQQNLDYYKARGADLMNKTRASAKAAPLNINKVSNSLLNFGRKLIAPAMASGGAVGAPASGSSFPPPAVPIRSSVETPQHHHHHHHQPHHHQAQQQRMMKSESMPVQLGKGQRAAGGDAGLPGPAQHPPALPGQSSKNISSSPSIESLSGGREFTGSPPLSASKKDSFFSTISRSRSQSKTMSRKESEEELEAQISFLQGQLNDLEAMCKYCAKMMNTHLGNIQEVILQEHLEKEDEILVSLAGLKQIKDILKGSLRFNQSQLEAEENEQITIADDHYCSNSQNKGTSDVLKGPVMTKQQFISGRQTTTDSNTSESKSADDYIMVSKEEEGSRRAVLEPAQPHQAHKEAAVKPEAPSRSSLIFSDPLMGSISASSSNLSSSPDDDSSNNSKDSDFAIVSPLDI